MRTTPSYSPTPMPNSTSERSGFHRASGGKRKNMNLLRCSANVLTNIPQKRSRCRVPCFVGYGPANSEHLRDNPQGLQADQGRVGMWRGGVRSTMSVAAPFVWRCLSGSAITPRSVGHRMDLFDHALDALL